MTQVQLTVGDEEADEMAQHVHKTLLKPAADAVLRGIAGPAR